jgi:hypothetical protein
MLLASMAPANNAPMLSFFEIFIQLLLDLAFLAAQSVLRDPTDVESAGLGGA